MLAGIGASDDIINSIIDDFNDINIGYDDNRDFVSYLNLNYNGICEKLKKYENSGQLERDIARYLNGLE
jgi:hypothetical protein